MKKSNFLLISSVVFIFVSNVLIAEEGLKPSQKAPTFVLKTIDGEKTVRSKNIFSEKELTVLIFWDSYCPDCLKAVIDCQRFYKNMGDLNVGVWSINFDDKKLADAKRFIKAEKISFPVLSDSRGVITKKYKAKAYDFSFFIIDKKGVIRYVCYDHPPNVGDLIKEEVKKILK